MTFASDRELSQNKTQILLSCPSKQLILKIIIVTADFESIS
jgi:hypothetical protein